MVTDDERREVAERLLDWTWKSAPSECLLNQIVFGDYCPGMNDNPDTITCHECEVMAAQRLADLIYQGDMSQGRRDIVACDREALLELADEMDAYSGHFSTGLQECTVQAWADGIREALGVCRED